MAGHSKWAQIKRKKGVTDARRGKLWTKLLKEVTVAARMGGGDPTGNPRLRSAVQEAKSNNVPNDNIDRAILRGSGQLEGSSFEEFTYEGYAPGGTAVLVETLTDNKNRTVSEVRHLFSKSGGNLGETGCVGWMFEKRGYFSFSPSSMKEDEFMELALEVGALDVATSEESFEMFTSPEEFSSVRDALEERNLEPDIRQLAMIPQTYVSLEAGVANRVVKLLEALEDNDDVQNVWSNCDFDAEVLAAQES